MLARVTGLTYYYTNCSGNARNGKHILKIEQQLKKILKMH